MDRDALLAYVFGEIQPRVSNRLRHRLAKRLRHPIEQYVTVGEDYGPWTDIYALGAVMYRCITGAPPIEAPGRVLKDPVQPAVEIGAGLYSPGILQVVDQALAVRPEDRFQSVAAMRQALLAAERSDDQMTLFAPEDEQVPS